MEIAPGAIGAIQPLERLSKTLKNLDGSQKDKMPLIFFELDIWSSVIIESVTIIQYSPKPPPGSMTRVLKRCMSLESELSEEFAAFVERRQIRFQGESETLKRIEDIGNSFKSMVLLLQNMARYKYTPRVAHIFV